MKSLSLINLTIVGSMILMACEPPTPSSTSTPAPAPTPMPTPAPILSNSKIELMPVNGSPLTPTTQIEFLIDNSGSVDREDIGCGNRLGPRRFDFIRSVLKLFRYSIPDPLSRSLFLGIGYFGNDYSTGLPPTSIQSLPSSPINPKIPEGDTRYSVGIQKAINEMGSQLADKRYLIIITDGDFATETSEYVKFVLEQQIINHKELQIFIALICPDRPMLAYDASKWSLEIDTIERVDVFFSLEDLAGRLFNEIQLFLPDSSVFVPSDNKLSMSLPGHYTSATFFFWSTEAQNGFNLTDTSVQPAEQKPVDLGKPEDFGIVPLTGCIPHQIEVVPDITSKWFVFVQYKTFESLQAILTDKTGTDVEIVNYSPLDIHIELVDHITTVDLRRWRDCFSVEMSWISSSGLSGKLEGIPCENSVFLCLDYFTEKLSGSFHWDPTFYETDNVHLDILLTVKDDPIFVWKGTTEDLNIKFRPRFVEIMDQNNLTNDPLAIIVANYHFIDVVAQPSIFLATSLQVFELDDESDKLSPIIGPAGRCPNPPYIVNQGDYIGIYQPPANCALENTLSGNNVCFSVPDIVSLERVYSLTAFNYVVSNCKFDTLFFIWENENEISKPVAWMCPIGTDQICQISIITRQDIK